MNQTRKAILAGVALVAAAMILVPPLVGGDYDSLWMAQTRSIDFTRLGLQLAAVTLAGAAAFALAGDGQRRLEAGEPGIGGGDPSVVK